MTTMLFTIVIFAFMASALALGVLFGKPTVRSSCNGRMGLPCPGNCKNNNLRKHKRIHHE